MEAQTVTVVAKPPAPPSRAEKIGAYARNGAAIAFASAFAMTCSGSCEMDKQIDDVKTNFAAAVKENPGVSEVSFITQGVTRAGKVRHGFAFDGEEIRRDTPCASAKFRIVAGTSEVPFMLRVLGMHHEDTTIVSYGEKKASGYVGCALNAK